MINCREVLRRIKELQTYTHTYNGDYYPIPDKTFKEAFRLLDELVYDSQDFCGLPDLHISSCCDSQEVSLFFGWEGAPEKIWITVEWRDDKFLYGLLYCPFDDESTWIEEDDVESVISTKAWQMFLIEYCKFLMHGGVTKRLREFAKTQKEMPDWAQDVIDGRFWDLQ